MKLRKRFNILGPVRWLAVAKQGSAFYEKAKAEATEWNATEKKWVDLYNGKCPACMGTKVVDRIVTLRKGAFSSDGTEKVNHCSECGNDWERMKPRERYSGYFEDWWLQILADSFKKDPDADKMAKAERLFEGLYAETVVHIYSRNYGDAEKISLKKLRTRFPSVYDKDVKQLFAESFEQQKSASENLKEHWQD